MDNETITKANFPNDKHMLEPSERLKRFRKEFQKLCKKHGVVKHYLSVAQEDDKGRMVGAVISSALDSSQLKIIIQHAISTRERMIEVERLDSLDDATMQ
jgi:hypothetical protein